MKTGDPGAKNNRGRKSQTSSSRDLIPLPLSFQLSANDVVCMRGRLAFDHEGNRRFRSMVEQNLRRYSIATKFQKSQIVLDIFTSVQQASPQGGFVKILDDKWYRCADTTAKEKVGQTFRDLMQSRGSKSKSASLKPSKKQFSVGAIPTIEPELTTYSSDPGFLSQLDRSSGLCASSASAGQPVQGTSSNTVDAAAQFSLVNVASLANNMAYQSMPLAHPPGILHMPPSRTCFTSDSFPTIQRQDQIQMTSALNNSLTLEATRSLDLMLEQKQPEDLEPMPLSFPNPLQSDLQQNHNLGSSSFFIANANPNTATMNPSNNMNIATNNNNDSSFEEAMEALYRRME